MNVKSFFKPIWRLEGRISEYVALVLRARAFGLSSAPHESHGIHFQSEIKLHCGIFQLETCSETAPLSVMRHVL